MRLGKREQRKGRNGEIELVRILNECGIPAAVGAPLNYGSEADITNIPGLHAECKRTEKIRLSDWLEQAEADAAKFADGAPTIFWRKNRSPWMVFMRLQDWLELYGRALVGGFGRSEPPRKEECE